MTVPPRRSTTLGPPPRLAAPPTQPGHGPDRCARSAGRRRSARSTSKSGRAWLPALALIFAVIAGLAPASGAEEAHDLRGDIPPGSAVREQIAELEREGVQLQQSLARAETDLAAALAERDRLGEELSRLLIEIEELRDSSRQLAVGSFVSGGADTAISILLGADGLPDLARRMQLLGGITEPLDETSTLLGARESQAGDELLLLVDRIEALRKEIESIHQDLPVNETAGAQARALLVVADAWDRADLAIMEGRYGFAPRAGWEALRFCESTDNYRAVNPSGRYRGAYQFDLPTWESVGGTGDPAEASPSEQDARARELYARRGHSPWPVCGRFVR